MSEHAEERGELDVLRSKRNATRYRILIEIAERQPAVNQQEIADAIGVTAQAVSDYLGGLVEQGYVDKQGRGRYEVTKEGVDWLISRTEELRGLVEHVTEDVVGSVEVETALATTDVTEGETVGLRMRDGVLRAGADDGDGADATAVAVTDAAAGQDVGITGFEGVVEYDLGTVTVVSVPRVQDGGSSAADPEMIADLAGNHDLVAVAGVEALAAASAADLDPDVRFGSAAAVREAATKGLDVLLVAATNLLSTHTDELREGNIGYEVVDVDDAAE